MSHTTIKVGLRVDNKNRETFLLIFFHGQGFNVKKVKVRLIKANYTLVNN